MLSIDRLCEILNGFSAVTQDSAVENCTSYFTEGNVSKVSPCLDGLSTFTLSEGGSIADYITLVIDDETVAINEFQEFMSRNHFAGLFQLTVDTKDLIQNTWSQGGDIDEFLFTSIDAFKSNFVDLGLSEPLKEGFINTQTNTRIHVHGLEKPFGGPNLAIVPTFDVQYGPAWLQGSSLPSTDTLLKQVHLITSDKINLELKNFELSWGDLNQPVARTFKVAFAQHLLVAISTNFYSIDKVQLKGVKHIDASIVSNNNIDISSEWLDILTSTVLWCYSIEDPSTPLQLLVDRLSLEYSEGSLLEINYLQYECCLTQAKSNYRFVIAKRSDDYRKELKDIYTDIKAVTDKYMEKSASLSSELLKSLLAIGMIFTVGTVSKAVVNLGLLHSKEGVLLFKTMGVYLFVSFLIRWLNASADLKVKRKALNSWSGKLHSHIPTTEVQSLIKEQLRYSTLYYLFTLATVTFIQGFLTLAAFNIQGVLWFLGL